MSGASSPAHCWPCPMLQGRAVVSGLAVGLGRSARAVCGERKPPLQPATINLPAVSAEAGRHSVLKRSVALLPKEPARADKPRMADGLSAMRSYLYMCNYYRKTIFAFGQYHPQCHLLPCATRADPAKVPEGGQSIARGLSHIRGIAFAGVGGQYVTPTAAGLRASEPSPV